MKNNRNKNTHQLLAISITTALFVPVDFSNTLYHVVIKNCSCYFSHFTAILPSLHHYSQMIVFEDASMHKGGSLCIGALVDAHGRMEQVRSYVSMCNVAP